MCLPKFVIITAKAIYCQDCPCIYTNLHRAGKTLSNPGDTAYTSKQRRVDRPAHLHLQPVVQLLEQLHCASAEVLFRALSGPHRLLMNADEVDPDFAVGLRDGRWVLDDEVDRPRVVPVEGTLLDVMTGVLIWRVVVESPLQDMCVECNGCKNE